MIFLHNFHITLYHMRNDQNTPNVQQWYNNKTHCGETQSTQRKWVLPFFDMTDTSNEQKNLRPHLQHYNGPKINNKLCWQGLESVFEKGIVFIKKLVSWYIPILL
jgi:hypothetical protein